MHYFPDYCGSIENLSFSMCSSHILQQIYEMYELDSINHYEITQEKDITVKIYFIFGHDPTWKHAVLHHEVAFFETLTSQTFTQILHSCVIRIFCVIKIL